MLGKFEKAVESFQARFAGSPLGKRIEKMNTDDRPGIDDSSLAFYVGDTPGKNSGDHGESVSDNLAAADSKISQTNKEKGELQKNKEGLEAEEKGKIKEITGWSNEILDAIGSMEEADIYMKAGLKEAEINGKKCLIRDDITLDLEDEDGITNKERMERGRPPITKDGEEIELHHIGQKQSSPLAELTMEQHRGVGNDGILHNKTKETEIDRNEFGKERREHWKDRVDAMEEENKCLR